MPIYSWPVQGIFIPAIPPGKPIPFLGRGLFSPLRENSETADFQRVADEANVKQCIRDGLLTSIGERVMGEPIGTIARDLLFEESEVVTDLLEPSIRDFFDRFEPRVVVQSVRVVSTEINAEFAAFKCSIVYVIQTTNQRDNLVFPFYLAAQAQA